MLPQLQEKQMTDPDAPTSTSSSGQDWREQRRAEKRARKAARRDGRDSWNGLPIGGLIIIAVGVVFLAGNFGFHLPARWWATFVLLPAAGALVTAARFYRQDEAATSRVVGSATGGVLMLAVALALFLGVDWGQFWPVLVIIVGLGVVTRGAWRG